MAYHKLINYKEKKKNPCEDFKIKSNSKKSVEIDEIKIGNLQG